MPAERSDAMETIDADVPCARCGYNLRTLPRDGSCPECGQSVSISLGIATMRATELGELRQIDPTRLRSLRRGATLATVAWFAGLPTMCCVDGSSTSDAFGGSVWLFLFIAPYVVSHWSAWHVVATSPVISRRSVRVAVLVGLAAVALMFVNAQFVSYYGRSFRLLRAVPEGWLAFVQTLGRLGSLAWPTMIACVMTSFVRLAWRARQRKAAIVIAVTEAFAILAAGAETLTVLGEGMDSSQFVSALIGPTGLCPQVWTAILFGFAELVRNPQALLMLVVAPLAVLAVGVSIAMPRLVGALTRAIQLGELPAASSRSSPAPRPPA